MQAERVRWDADGRARYGLARTTRGNVEKHGSQRWKVIRQAPQVWVADRFPEVRSSLMVGGRL